MAQAAVTECWPLKEEKTPVNQFFFRKKQKCWVIFPYISSYAKILEETNFHTWEIPRSGSKAEDGGKKRKRERKKERLNNGENNGQATHGARKHAWRTQAALAKNQKQS